MPSSVLPLTEKIFPSKNRYFFKFVKTFKNNACKWIRQKIFTPFRFRTYKLTVGSFQEKRFHEKQQDLVILLHMIPMAQAFHQRDSHCRLLCVTVCLIILITPYLCSNKIKLICVKFCEIEMSNYHVNNIATKSLRAVKSKNLGNS